MFAWLGYYRRLFVRYDRTLRSYQSFFLLACSLATFGFLLKWILKPLLGLRFHSTVSEFGAGYISKPIC